MIRFQSYILCGVFLTMLCSPFLASAEMSSQCGVFSRNLKLGMTGEDVRALQVFLNGSEITRVANEGPGSSGNETTYFGLKTKLAVSLFQEKYASDVLFPAGLTKGNGFVGTFSRAKIASLCLSPASPSVLETPTTIVPATTTFIGGKVGTADIPATTSIPSQPSEQIMSFATETPLLFSLANATYKSETPVIMFLSKVSVPRNTSMTISGVGFAPTGNVIHLDGFTISSSTLNGSGVLSFTIPDTAPYGEHDIWVSNAKGESNKTWIVITKPDVLPPTITSFTPTEGFQGTVVTVTGNGFTPTGNQIRASGGILNDISSTDGKTLQFTASLPIEGLNVGQDVEDVDIREAYGFTVVNTNGVSDQKVFYFKI